MLSRNMEKWYLGKVQVVKVLRENIGQNSFSGIPKKGILVSKQLYWNIKECYHSKINTLEN